MLADCLPRKLPVKRDGNFQQVDVSEIVAGDEVFLRAGNVAQAAMMWLEGDVLVIGPPKSPDAAAEAPREASIEAGPDSGMIQVGAIVRAGEAECVGTATGRNAHEGGAGRAAGVQQHAFTQDGRLAARALLAACLLSVAALLGKALDARVATPPLEAMRMVLSLVLASAPVLFRIVVRALLASGVKQMVMYDSIATDLTVPERLASMDMLLADKTGTLTAACLAVDRESALVADCFDCDRLLELAALACDPGLLSSSKALSAVDVAIFRAFAECNGFGGDLESASGSLHARFALRSFIGSSPLVRPP